MGERGRRREAILGCLLGGAIGDALGSPHEGRLRIDPEEIGRFGPITDDTQMTLATCEAIVEAGGRVDPARIADAFVRWYRAGRLTGLGSATTKALVDLAAGAHWGIAGRTGEYAAGNGAAMRIAPLAFCLGLESDADRRTLRDVVRITHRNEEAYVGALAVALAVAQAAAGATLHGLAERLPDSRVRDRLREVLSQPETDSLQDLARKYGRSGWVVETVPLAVTAAARGSQLGFESMLREVIACGGDTDTIAAIAGQIAGAKLGGAALPQSLPAALPDESLVRSVASRFTSVVV